MTNARPTVLASLEVDSVSTIDIDIDSNVEGTSNRIAVVFRYVALASLAVSATSTCPGNTVLWVNVNTNESEIQWFIIARLALISILTLTGFVLVHCSDPGFLTTELTEKLQDSALEEESLMGGDESVAFNPLAPPSWTIDPEDPVITSNFPAGTWRRKCDKCNFSPFIRSHHCKECHRCVATFDHHCKLVGVCIGERNRSLFWWFLLAQWCGFVTCCTIVNSSQLGLFTLLQPHDSASLRWNGMRVVATKMYLYPLTFVATIMLAMHSFLALTNMTTFECVKGPRHLDYLKGTQDMDLPFSQGIYYNLKSYGCGYGCCKNRTDWTPTVWRPPGKIIRDSEEWWNHPWQNKYWSCC